MSHCNVIATSAVGRQAGWLELPQFDYSRPLAVGSIEFGTQQIEPIGQPRGNDSLRREVVELVALDVLPVAPLDFAKIDVEGMEFDALEDAVATIERLRPAMLVECLKGDRAAVRVWLKQRGCCLLVGGHNCLCGHAPVAVAAEGWIEE